MKVIVLLLMATIASTALCEGINVIDEYTGDVNVSDSLQEGSIAEEEFAGTNKVCTHELLEAYGDSWNETLPVNSVFHRHVTKSRAKCDNKKCSYETVVIVNSVMEAHEWSANGDHHISDTKHIYYQICRACGQEDQYTVACGGNHYIV